jgi:hypothetical protein
MLKFRTVATKQDHWYDGQEIFIDPSNISAVIPNNTHKNSQAIESGVDLKVNNEWIVVTKESFEENKAALGLNCLSKAA